MDVKAFSESLMEKMESDFSSVDDRDALKAATIKANIARTHLIQLKRFVLDYTFLNEAEEIHFFKIIKPKFLSQLLYYTQVLRVELLIFSSSPRRRMRYLKNELNNIGSYLIKNRKFYRYLLSERSDLDRVYFLRNSAELTDVTLDNRFITPMDRVVSEIAARMRLKQYLSQLTHTLHKATFIQSRLQWFGSKTDLIELVYALHASKAFGSNVEIKDIISLFESFIDCDLNQYSRVFLEIRQRKKGCTNFLDELKSKLIEKIQLYDA